MDTKNELAPTLASARTTENIYTDQVARDIGIWGFPFMLVRFAVGFTTVSDAEYKLHLLVLTREINQP